MFGSLIGTIVYDQLVSVIQPVIALSATGLYLTHSLAALASVLPYDAVVSPGVLLGWMVRASGIVAAGAIVSVPAAVVLVGPASAVGHGRVRAASVARWSSMAAGTGPGPAGLRAGRAGRSLGAGAVSAVTTLVTALHVWAD